MFGIYIYVEFFTQTSILLALLVGAMTYASVLVVFTHFPSTLSVRFLPWVFTLLVTLLIVMYMMEGQLRLINAKNGEDERFAALLTLEGAQISLLGLYAAIMHSKPNAFSSWGVDWQVKVQKTSSTRQQPITKSLHVEGSTQEDMVSKGKSLATFTSCHVSNISDEDATTNRHSSVNETKDKVVDLLKGEHSNGWDSYLESIIKKYGCQR